MHASWLPGATGAVLLSSVLAAGCASKDAPPAQAYIQAVAPLTVAAPALDVGLKEPPLRLGDTFVFDNPPEQWEVIALDKTFVGWQSRAGDFMQTAWSTLLPPLRWGGTGSTLDSGQRRLTRLEGRFFPLKTGNKVSFLEERVSSRPAGTFVALWECEVGKEAEIVVPAGKAQTWEVLCLVNGRERVFVNYAENIGHYVRHAVDNGGGPVIRQLTGFARGKSSDISTPAPPSNTAK